MTLERYRLKVTGTVQGVGFRPFVYNLAGSLSLKGWVANTGGGVTIEAEGAHEALEAFVEAIGTEAPPLSCIQHIETQVLEFKGYKEFTIEKSLQDSGRNTFISPDMSVCSDCARELFSPDDRRYLYPFINCTNCGPRFTIIKDVPYDRPNTTMDKFVMCSACRSEYEAPADRRYHAQPVSCFNCGPTLALLDRDGKKVSCSDIPAMSAGLLKEGRILAIKGLGGYHLACDAQNRAAVTELRRRKHRDEKPFALMASGMETVLEYCTATEEEARLLESMRRPVVLLHRRAGCSLPDEIAPKNPYLGMMLPYTPVHLLLFRPQGRLESFPRLLVMTSGNVSSEPICYKDEEALDRLHGIADYFLANDREIHMRTDDTVTRVFMGGEYIIRRSRGYVPSPLLLKPEVLAPDAPHILACGGELKNTFCLSKGSEVYMSHHIGDLENLETMGSFEDGIFHFSRLFDIKPSVVAYDMHPDYLSTVYALESDIPVKIPVQHHKAHIASCMAENSLSGEVIGVAFDGTGYGEDGKIWGSEFFTGTYGSFRRAGHFSYAPMPGGEAAAREPWRMAASYLYGASRPGSGAARRDLSIFPRHLIEAVGEAKLGAILEMVEKGFNSPATCGMGRLFEAVSAIAGIRYQNSYEGQAAMELEFAAADGYMGEYPYFIKNEDGAAVVDSSGIILGVAEDVGNQIGADIVSARFHRTIAAAVAGMCRRLREVSGLGRVVLSGGVFQNMLLLSQCLELLGEEGFQVFIHSRVPANDGGISLGQAAIAMAEYRKFC